MEFNALYLNPFQLTGCSKSLYAIKDYFQIDPAFQPTSPNAFQHFVLAATNYGLKVIMDLVINHTAVDATLVATHPEWYHRKANGDLVHPGCKEHDQWVEWGDLAELDTANPQVLDYIKRIVTEYLSYGVSGFRCDAAYKVPPWVWKEIIKHAKSINKDAMFLAETLGCSAEETRKTAEAGFDYIFNSSKWWQFDAPWCIDQYNATRNIAPSISFPESHDTERLAKECNGDIRKLMQRYLFATLFSKGVMMPAGYEVGNQKKLHVCYTTPNDWEEHCDLTGFIRKCNQLKNELLILNIEAPIELEGAFDMPILHLRKTLQRNETDAIILINRTDQVQHSFCSNLEFNKHVRLASIGLDKLQKEIPNGFDMQPYEIKLLYAQADLHPQEREIVQQLKEIIQDIEDRRLATCTINVQHLQQNQYSFTIRKEPRE